VSLEAGKRPPETRSTTKNTEFRVVFDLILIENDEIFLRLRDRCEIRHLCRGSLDQKKSEWKELLDLASKVEQFMPSVAVGGELIKTVHDPLFRDYLRDMTQTILKCIFISEFKREKIYNSLLNVQLVNEQSKGHIEDHNSNAHLAQALGKPRPLEAAQNVQSELIALRREIRLFASEDMDIVHQRQWWKLLVGILKKPRKPKVEGNASQDRS